MLSREFCLDTTLKIWDFIFSGIEAHSLTAALQTDEANIDFDSLLKVPANDPFINMECVSVAMIAQKKADLLESDFSMCLGLLMSYREPEDPTIVLEHANRVRQALLANERYQRMPSPEPDTLESAPETEDTITPFNKSFATSLASQPK